MAANDTECREFLDAVIDEGLLHRSIEWISDNLGPDDVFEADDLNDWARENKGKLDAGPEDLFDDTDLEEWAAGNGYVKKDDDAT